jgi:hypothetical protein
MTTVHALMNAFLELTQVDFGTVYADTKPEHRIERATNVFMASNNYYG